MSVRKLIEQAEGKLSEEMSGGFKKVVQILLKNVSDGSKRVERSLAAENEKELLLAIAHILQAAAGPLVLAGLNTTAQKVYDAVKQVEAEAKKR